MPTYIAVRIHNNSLGRCIKVDSADIGIAILKEWMAEDNVEITEETLQFLDNDLEYHDESDIGNLRTYSIGIAE